MRNRLKKLYKEATAGRHALRDRWWFRWVLEAVHVLLVLTREAARDRLHVRAAMLAYWTCVAIVPILVLGFAVTGPMGIADTSTAAVRTLLYDTILASSIEDVGRSLDALLIDANLGALGIVGVAGTMLIGSQLYFAVELAFNDVLGVRLKRSWMLRFTLFYAGITLGPLFIAGGFVASANLPDAATILSRAVPVVLTATAFIGGIRLLPCAPITWRAAIIGGLVSAVLFEAAKMGFGAYTEVLGTRDNLARLYGSVALLPVFLLWLNVLWLVVLLGAEVAYVTQNFDLLIESQRRRAVDPYAPRRRADGFFAVAVMTTVTRNFLEGHGAIGPLPIAREAGAAPRHVQAVLDVLEDARLVVQSEDKRYLPARPPERITASEVIHAWRRCAAPRWARSGPADAVIQRGLAAVDKSLSATMDSIVTGYTGDGASN